MSVTETEAFLFVSVTEGFSVCVSDSDRSFPSVSVSVTEGFSVCVSDGRLFCLSVTEGFSVCASDGRRFCLCQ